MSVVRARQKPVEIEAIQLTADNWSEVAGFAAPHVVGDRVRGSEGELRLVRVYVYTIEGTMTARPGDWVIKDMAGKFRPCKPDIFDATYEIVE